MAKNSIRDFDATSSNNTDIQSVDISEGCSPAGINNAIRELMADIKDVSAGTVALESPQADSLTVTGDLTVDTNTLYVDSTNNRVGVGTASPAVPLHVKVGTNENFYMSSDSGVRMQAINDAASAVNTMKIGGDPLIFLGTGGTERMRIGSSGIGIGTTNTSPSSGISGVVNFNGSGNGFELHLTDSGSGSTDSDGCLFSWNNPNQYIYNREAGPIIFGTSNTERMRIDPSGNVLVGTTTAGISNSLSTSIEASGYNNSRIYVNHSSGGSSNGSLFMGFGYGGSTIGSITQASTSSVAYNTSSDYRLKENVTDITDGITRLKLLNPSRFNFIADADTTVDGFLAHEVSDIVPEAVTGEKDAMQDEEYEVTPAVLDDDGNVVTEAVMGTRSVPKYQGIDQSKLVPLLTAALQEAVAKIETLEAKVTALENA